MNQTALRLFPLRNRHPGNGNGNGHGGQDAWQALRRAVGARPSGIVQFPTRRSRLEDLVPGEKFLIVRKYGGLGDILIASMIFPMLADQYPGIRTVFACPREYHPLFDGSGLELVAYEDVWALHGMTDAIGGVRAKILERYDLIEDISFPCHTWQNFFIAYGGIDGNPALKWRNRLDMWANWFGLSVRDPRTNIVIRRDEIEQARRLIEGIVGRNRPACLLAPFSRSRTKSYPWFERLACRLADEGFAVLLLHPKRAPSSIPTLTHLPLRAMGAACAAADLVVSVDSAAFHWGGILRRPTVGIYNTNDGATYARYYPTARTVQACPTPCIDARYGPGNGTCPRHIQEKLPSLAGSEFQLSRCYAPATVEQVVLAARATLRSEAVLS